jgi:hypothetical protein
MATPTAVERKPLSPPEQRIKNWLAKNYGVLTRVSKELGLSIAFVQRVAYNRGARSRGLKVERRLLELGAPLIQRLK